MEIVRNETIDNIEPTSNGNQEPSISKNNEIKDVDASPVDGGDIAPKTVSKESLQYGALAVDSITANSGTIGAFQIGSDYIRDTANSFGLASTATAGNDVRFWAGDTYANRATAPARIYENGEAHFTTNTSDALDITGTAIEYNGSRIFNTPIYGNGADGDATIAVNTALTRDMYYHDLTVNNGVILDCAGYRLFVKGTLTNNGTIQRTPNVGGNGTNGTSAFGSSTGGTKGSAASALSGANLAGGVAGAAGGDGGAGAFTRNTVAAAANGTNGSVASNGSNIATGVGSNGSAGKTGATGGTHGQASGGNPGVGGNGGTAGSITTKYYPFAFPECVQMLNIVTGASPTQHNSSAGTGGSGGGGAGAPTGNSGSSGYTGAGGGGGGSGSAGGVVVVCARTIVNTGSILAPGGRGGNGGNGANCSKDSGGNNLYGGGGGGGAGGNGGAGGVLTIIYNKLTNSGTIAASGGAGGSGGSGGAGGGLGGNVGGTGATGDTGTTGTLIELQN